MPRYIPKKGDFITISFDPQAGHEQKGRGPALVLSNDLFTKHTGDSVETAQSITTLPDKSLDNL